MEEFKVPTLPSSGPVPKAERPLNDTSNADGEMELCDERPKQTECPYKMPNWSGKPNDCYKFEVLKSGQIIEEVAELQKQAAWKFGRLPENDIVMAHPTISRFHAILQYRPKKDNTNDDNGPAEGWYIYDLDSTHGTFLNKQRIPPRVYIRIQVGHMLRLGASTRSYILQGPAEDEEPETELSVTELREQRQQQQENAAEMKRKAAEAAAEQLRNEGIDWGMGEDADEETDLSHNPYASSNNEELFLDDPKKTLRGYFEREDIPLEYRCDEMSAGCFVCRVELNIDDANGKPIIAEVIHKGRKKDCVLQCALEACRILDRHGVLRQANQEPSKRRAKAKDSDSDDDEFWDRTGDVARRKERKANSNSSITLSYDDLVKKEEELSSQLQQVETNITEYLLKQKHEKALKEAQDDTDLDSFMQRLDEDVTKLDKTEIKKLRFEQQRLKNEHLKIQRLIKVTKPYELPFSLAHKSSNDESNLLKKQLPMIGKRNQFSKFKVVKLSSPVVKSSETYASDEEEMEDDNEDQVENDQKLPKQKPCIVEKRELLDSKKLEDLTEEQHNTSEKTMRTEITVPAQTPDEIQNPRITKFTSESTENIEMNSINLAIKSETATHLEKTDTSIVKGQTQSSENNAKKRHHPRQRQRGKRQEVDIDELDEHESSEKYAKWVPPPNQTGDGFTKLNEKYGY